jgi:hypothetical protein
MVCNALAIRGQILYPHKRQITFKYVFKIIFNDIYVVVSAVQFESCMTALLEELDVCFIYANAGCFLNPWCVLYTK